MSRELTPRAARRMAQQLLEWADALEAAEKDDKASAAPAPAPAKPPRPAKTPAQRVHEALKRAPSYAHRYPGFAHILSGNAMTRTQIRRAIGNAPNAAQIVDAGIRELMASNTAQLLNVDRKTRGRNPEIFVLTESAHVFDKPNSVLPPSPQDVNDPFANEWTPPWRLQGNNG